MTPRPPAGLLPILALLLVPCPATAEPALEPRTEELYLSGRGPSDAVAWEFRCEVENLDAGRGCGEWTTIPVPSNWELEGFGTYDYGHDEDKARDVGQYRRAVRVPAHWEGRRVHLLFDGVMTDARVRLDGQTLTTRDGRQVHRGSFYPFAYDVTDRVTPGGEHLLEVTVHEHSSDHSVNAAERDADYWVFGGIYRPVRLLSLPREALDHVAVDARHDGSFRMLVRTSGVAERRNGEEARVEVTLRSLDGRTVGRATSGPLRHQESTIEATFEDVAPWSAETPHLHLAEIRLLRGDRVLHRVDRRVGFRTVELRRPVRSSTPGLYVNGERVLLRGVNRHAFWPDTGRAVDPALDRADVERMKSMGLNAVRTAHYPPNRAFLDAADELGLYVIDELGGWHEAYDTEVGRPLVRAMVERDVSHPSVIFWSNGNEDGWNPALDGDFGLHDPQDRPVIHPRSVFRGIDAPHYDSYDELRDRLDPASWLNRWRDLVGNLPLLMPTEILHGLYDGGSGAGLAEYWQLLQANERALGLFLWAFTDEAVVRTDRDPSHPDYLDTDGNHAPDGILGPYRETSAQELAVRRVFRPRGEEPAEPEIPAAEAIRTLALRQDNESSGFVEERDGEILRLTNAEGRGVELDAETLRLRALLAAGERLELPSFVPTRATRADDAPSALAATRSFRTHLSRGVEARYDDASPLRRLRWQVFPSGWVRLAWTLEGYGEDDLPGIVLPLDEAALRAVTWEGLGPVRQWRNRTAGVWGHHHEVWRRGGELLDAGLRWSHEPKLRGFYRARLATLHLEDADLTLAFEDDSMHLGLFRPRFPDDARDAVARVWEPEGVALLHRISAIGTKFHPADEISPPPPIHEGPRFGAAWLFLGRVGGVGDLGEPISTHESPP